MTTFTNELTENIHWVGAIDWNIRKFHGYVTNSGSSYNSYLINDEIPTLIDSVKDAFLDEHLDRISAVISPDKIQQIVINHAEADHTSALLGLLEFTPNATIIANKLCKQLLIAQFPHLSNFPFKLITEEDEISTGNRRLKFVFTQIHWPESMWTYEEEKKIIFSNDAFGQHFASTERFYDELVDDQMLNQLFKEYTANILGPCKKQCQKMVGFLDKFQPEQIFPAHGVAWNGKSISISLSMFKDFAFISGKQNKICVIFDTMFNQTEFAAKIICEGIYEKGVKFSFLDLRVFTFTQIAYEVLECKGIVFGSPTMNNCPSCKIVSVLRYLIGLSLMQGKKLAFFGSFGWDGKSVSKMIKIVQSRIPKFINICQYQFKYAVGLEDRKQLFQMGVKIAEAILENEEVCEESLNDEEEEIGE